MGVVASFRPRSVQASHHRGRLRPSLEPDAPASVSYVLVVSTAPSVCAGSPREPASFDPRKVHPSCPFRQVELPLANIEVLVNMPAIAGVASLRFRAVGVSSVEPSGRCEGLRFASRLPAVDERRPIGLSREGQGRRSWMTRHSRNRDVAGSSQSCGDRRARGSVPGCSTYIGTTYQELPSPGSREPRSQHPLHRLRQAGVARRSTKTTCQKDEAVRTPHRQASRRPRAGGRPRGHRPQPGQPGRSPRPCT